MNAGFKQRVEVRGDVFGARGCSSCSCDPCDCNPCTCEDSMVPSYPYWRVSGYSISEGEIDGICVSNQILLSLALPVDTNNRAGAWYEVLLVDEHTTYEQMQALLKAFEASLHSLPAEIKTFSAGIRAVYTLPLHYMHESELAHLQVDFDPEHARLMRAADNEESVGAWSYDGPITLRGNLQ